MIVGNITVVRMIRCLWHFYESSNTTQKIIDQTDMNLAEMFHALQTRHGGMSVNYITEKLVNGV